MGPKRYFGRNARPKVENVVAKEATALTHETGMLSELPVLIYSETGGSSNYADFKEKVTSYLARVYGDAGLFMETDVLWLPDEPAEPETEFDALDRAQLVLGQSTTTVDVEE